jgi:hypothetical protein
MANSGNFQTNKYGGVRGLQFNWWLNSQDINGNYSDIGWNFVGYGSNSSTWYYTLNGYLNINGNRVFTQGSSKVQLAVGTVLASGTTRIYHNNDGSKSFGADGGATIYAYSTWETGSGSWSLPTIPRASSITSGGDYTKGDAVTVTISRASSNFTHTVQFFIGSEVIKQITGVGTSTTWTPTKSEVETLLSKGTGSTIRVYTYNGGTHIGTSTKGGTAYNPTSSKVTNDFSFTVGNKTSFTVERNKSYYTHSLEISVVNTLIKTISDVGTSAEWTPSSSELTAIYNAMKNTASATISVKCITYSRGANIGNTTKTGTIKIDSSGNEPTFTNWTYKNSNSISNKVLGTDQVMLQNRNSIVITCGSATAKNQASISKYQVVVNNSIYETTDTSKREITIPNLNLSGNVLFQARAIDSRGFITTVEKTLVFIAYNEPTIPEISLSRKNNYDEESKLKLSGSIALVRYNNQNKNDIGVFKYRYKDNTTSTYSNWVDILTSTIPDTAQKFHYDSSTGNFNLDETEIGNFDKDKTYQFEFIIQDKVGEYQFTGLLINGLPLMALRKRKVGINCVPDSYGKEGLYINGNFVPYESTVYDNTSGSTGNITLDEELDSPTYIIIQFKANNVYGSVRVDNPIGNKISLMIFDSSNSTLYTKIVTINKTQIVVNSYLRAVLGVSNTSNNDISITKIIKGN